MNEPGSAPMSSAAPASEPRPIARPATWDLLAPDYTACLLPFFQMFARDALRLAALPPRPDIVDVATGPGTLALLAAAEGARVSALDFSPAMTAELQARVRAAGLEGIDVRVGDGQDLPYPEDRFDGAFSLFGLMFFPDRARGFRELLRVLRPGGVAVVASWGPSVGAYGAMMASLEEARPGTMTGSIPLDTPEAVTREMSAAGFREVVVHTVTNARPYPSLESFWGDAQRSTVSLLLMRQQMDEAAWATLVAQVRAGLARRLGEGPVEDAGCAYLGVGRK